MPHLFLLHTAFFVDSQKSKGPPNPKPLAPEWGVREDWLEQLYGSACESIRGICKIE